MENAYIYTRVSTLIQVDGFSLDAQETEIRAFAEARISVSCASREKPSTCISVDTRVYMYALSIDGTSFLDISCHQ